MAVWGTECVVTKTVPFITGPGFLRIGHTREDIAVEVPTLQGIECAFANVVSVALAFAGIVLFIMLLVGGFKFLTSGGDQKQVEAARGTLTHAVMGLVVLVFAYVIILLISNLTGVNKLLDFKIVE